MTTSRDPAAQPTPSPPAFGPPQFGRLGYARRDVDPFVERLARGVVGVREVQTVRFVNRRLLAYDVDEVDAYLDRYIEAKLEQSLAERSRRPQRLPDRN